MLLALLAPVAMATLVAVVVLYPWNGAQLPRSVGTPVNGVVTAATSGPCLAPGQVQVGAPNPDDKRCLTVEVALSDGPAQGSTITKSVPLEPTSPRFAVGDEVVLSYSGADPTDSTSYQLQDFQRGMPLLLLGALFAGAVLLLGRWQGLASLVALGISFAVITLFVLPAILAGRDPLLVAIAGAGLIMFVALYLTHGLSARTSVAVLGTMVSLALIGTLSAIFSAMAKLTGLDSDTSTLIGSLGHPIDARGLLLAGVVIGALGVLDDVTVTQASSVWGYGVPTLTGLARSVHGRVAHRQGSRRIGRQHARVGLRGNGPPPAVVVRDGGRGVVADPPIPGRGPGDRADAGGQHRHRGGRAPDHVAGRPHRGAR